MRDEEEMMMRYITGLLTLALSAAVLILPSAAHADLLLDQVIVDIQADEPARGDIEISNQGGERMYVLIEPFEVLDPGLETERRVPLGNPTESRIFVSPTKVILEPGQRRTVRIAALGPRPETDRIFRVRIRPVVGELTAENDGLKVLIGYDALVLLRADQKVGKIVAQRVGQTMVIRNETNSAQELFAGTQCDEAGEGCVKLPSKRLYPQQEINVPLSFETTVKYKAAVGGEITELEF